MFSLSAISQSFSWPSFSREGFSDLTTRLSRAAPGYFRDLVPVAIALGSAYLSSRSFGAGCSVFLMAAIVNFLGNNPIDKLCSEIFQGKVQKNEVSQKVHDITSRKVKLSMIAYALLVGVAAAVTKSYLVSAGSFFYAALKTRNVFSLLFGMEDLAIGLAYGACYVKDYYSRALFLKRIDGSFEEEFPTFISSVIEKINQWDELNKRHIPREDQADRLEQLNRLNQQDPTQLSKEESLERKELERLKVLNKLLVEEKMKEKFYNVFSGPWWDFDHWMKASRYYPASLIRAYFACLASDLSDQQIFQIVQSAPHILTLDFLAENLPESRFRAIYMLQVISSERLQTIKVDFQGRIDAFKKSSQLLEDQNELRHIAAAHIDELESFLDRLESFSETKLSVPSLQDEIDQALLLKDQAREVLEFLTRNLNELGGRIEKTWEILTGTYLFDNDDCVLLAEDLELGKEKSWVELTEYLNKKGLPDKAALIRHKIIPEDDWSQNADGKVNVRKRLIDFCGPTRFSLFQFECSLPLKKIASVALTILKMGLLGFQIYRYPVPTLLGGISSFTVSLMFLSMKPEIIRELSRRLFSKPSHDIYGLAARVSWELFSCSYLRGGFFYGLWVGANAGVNYARRCIRYFPQAQGIPA